MRKTWILKSRDAGEETCWTKVFCYNNVFSVDVLPGHCNRKHIGIGVRYNAEKTRVGHYYTTPIYQFKMRCHLCSNAIVIRYRIILSG